QAGARPRAAGAPVVVDDALVVARVVAQDRPEDLRADREARDPEQRRAAPVPLVVEPRAVDFSPHRSAQDVGPRRGAQRLEAAAAGPVRRVALVARAL